MRREYGRVSLLSGTTTRQDVQQKCIDHLTTGSESTSLLFVTDRPRSEWVGRFTDGWESSGIDNATVVEVGERGSVDSSVSSNVSVELNAVEAASNLTDIALTISDVVGRWRAHDDDLHFSFCFDSLTYLLTQYQPEHVFRFSRAVEQYVLRVGGHGHFHLNPDAHDKRVVETLRTLFPDIVEQSIRE